MEKLRVLKMSKEDLENSIANLSSLKPVLQKSVILENGNDFKQGQTDTKELGKDFDTAISAMITVLGLIDGMDIEKVKGL